MPRDNFTNLDEEIMREIFDLFDSDGGGTIGREEVPEMIRTILFEVPTDAQVEALITKYDADNSGELDFEEFTNLMKDYVSPLDLTIPPNPCVHAELGLRGERFQGGAPKSFRGGPPKKAWRWSDPNNNKRSRCLSSQQCRKTRERPKMPSAVRFSLPCTTTTTIIRRANGPMAC